jgi:ABC-type dipeptide/oligopeptide/nickel transport system permease subunit
MSAPIEASAGAAEAAPDPVLAGVGGEAIQGRSLGQIAWMRLRRDKAAMAGGIIVLLLVLVSLVGPLVAQNPDTYHSNLINSTFSRPNGPLGGISLAHLLGVEPLTGRDMLARIVVGARYSLFIGFLATALAVVVGVLIGIVAGYFGGWVDALIARAMDIFLAFPLLVFAIALVDVIPSSAFGLSGNTLRVAILIVVIGLASGPYMGRIIRGQTLSLREREFVDAARSLGARAPYILIRELLPNLAGPILVYATLLIPTNILFEAALDYLGVGLIPPAPSWGQMLSNAVQQGFFSVDPMYMIIPGLAIFMTIMAFNLFGDGLRDALDPRGGRRPASSGKRHRR